NQIIELHVRRTSQESEDYKEIDIKKNEETNDGRQWTGTVEQRHRRTNYCCKRVDGSDLPHTRGRIKELHDREAACDNRGDPCRDVERPQAPRHLLGVTLGAVADVRKQAQTLGPILLPDREGFATSNPGGQSTDSRIPQPTREWVAPRH